MIRVIDFETTGQPPEAEVCEAACIDVVDGQVDLTSAWSSLVRPGRPMEIEALAVHHITDQEAATGLSWEEAQDRLRRVESEAAPIFCAHNAEFEQKFFNPEGCRWVDTYKVAVRLWPDAPRHSNQVLRYFLGLDLEPDLAMPPHRALPDAYVTAHILVEALKLQPLDVLLSWSEEPLFLTTIAFSKHRGQRFDDLPPDYLSWILRQPDMDEAVKAAAQRALDR